MFLPVSDVTDGFIELMMIYTNSWYILETHDIGKRKSEGLKRCRVGPIFPLELWNVCHWTCDKMPGTSNSIEALNNAVQETSANLEVDISLLGFLFYFFIFFSFWPCHSSGT